MENVPPSCCHKYNEGQNGGQNGGLNVTKISAVANRELNELQAVDGCEEKFNELFKGRYFNNEIYQSVTMVLISFQIWINLLSVALILYGGHKEEEAPLPTYEDILFIVPLDNY